MCIRDRAKAAQVDYFIRTLPDGYNTVINEEADNISQGQKQLLTIARAMLADSSILILDEATSSVDTRTEIRIQKAMDRLIDVYKRQAMGFMIDDDKTGKHYAQVSINMTNYEVTPLYRVTELVKAEARRWGARVVQTEVIGLCPMKAQMCIRDSFQSVSL